MNINILDSILQTFETVFIGGLVQVEGYAISLFGLLIAIDLILSILLNLQDADHIKLLIKKVLKYGFWIFFIVNYDMIINAILDSLSMVGVSIGGGTSIYLLKHPSEVVAQGFKLIVPFTSYLLTLKGMATVFSNFTVIIFTLIGVCSIIIAFAIIAIQILVTYCEFYLFACMFLIFIPFGSNKHTSFLAEKAIGGIMAYGVKLMVLGTILGIMAPIIKSWAIMSAKTPSFDVILGSMVVTIALAILCWQVPSMAAGVMQGAPTLSAGTIANNMVAAGAGVAAVGMAATGVGAAAAGAMAGGSAAAAGGGAAAAGGNVSAMQQAAGAVNTGATGASGAASSVGSALPSAGAQAPTFASPQEHYAGSASDSGAAAASAASSGGSESSGTSTANMASAVGAATGASSPAASSSMASTGNAPAGGTKTASESMSSAAGTSVGDMGHSESTFSNTAPPDGVRVASESMSSAAGTSAGDMGRSESTFSNTAPPDGVRVASESMSSAAGTSAGDMGRSEVAATKTEKSGGGAVKSAAVLSQVQRAVPQEATPHGGGMGPTIKSED